MSLSHNDRRSARPSGSVVQSGTPVRLSAVARPSGEFGLGPGGALRCEERPVDQRTDRRTHQRCHPERPQLCGRTVAVEERHTGRAGGVDRRVADRDRDQVNQGERQPDCQRSQSDGRTRIRGTQDDDDEEPGQQDLGDEYCGEGVVIGRVVAVTVGRHRSRALEVGLAAGDGPQGKSGDQAAHHLCDPTAGHILPGQTPTDGGAEAHRRIEVTAGDVADGVVGRRALHPQREPSSEPHISVRVDRWGLLVVNEVDALELPVFRDGERHQNLVVGRRHVEAEIVETASV